MENSFICHANKYEKQCLFQEVTVSNFCETKLQLLLWLLSLLEKILCFLVSFILSCGCKGGFWLVSPTKIDYADYLKA